MALKFIRTMSIAGAKKAIGTESISVEETPQGKSVVLKDDNGDVVGFCTTKQSFRKIKEPAMSEVETEDKDRLWILHEKSEAGEFKQLGTL